MRLPFSTVQPGQRLQFSATEHNAFIRAALKAEPGLAPGEDRSRGPGIRLINLTAGPFTAIEPGDVVRVGDEIRDTEADAPVNSGKYLLRSIYKLEIPTATDPLNSVYAIAEDGMTAVNETARGTIGEATVASVNVQNVSHRYARPNGKQLRSTTDPMSPYIILGTSPGTGVYDLNVWQKGISLVVRKATVTEPTGISSGSFGEVTIDFGGADEQWLGVDHVVDAYHDWILGEDISTGLKCFVCYFPEDDKWRILEVECEPEPSGAPPGHGDIVEASTTQTQAGAESLSYSVNRITVCDNDYDSVKLPDAVLEEHCYVMNDTDNILQAWADTGNRFTKQGPNSSVWIPARTGVDFQCVRANTWIDPRGHDTAGRTFDGTDDYISLAGASLPTTTFSNSFTLTFDVISPFTGTDNFGTRGYAADKLYSLRYNNKFAIGTNSGWVYVGNEDMQIGRYVIQYDTAQTGFARWKAWLNGVSKSTATTFGSHNDIAAGADDLNIGRRGTGINYAEMVIRDLRVFSALKSYSEVVAENTDDLELWWHLNDASDAATARDVSGNGRDGTYNGGPERSPQETGFAVTLANKLLREA